MSSSDLDGTDLATTRSLLREAVDQLGIASEPEPTAHLGPGRRRRRSVAVDEPVLTLVEQDGVLWVEEDRPAPIPGGRRRRSPRALGLDATIVDRVVLSRLGQNQVGGALRSLDDKLTPSHATVRELTGDTLVPLQSLRQQGRILLIVHGTFSNCDNFVAQVKQADNGGEFLTWMGRYDQVIAFDHPTLSVSPMINAHALDALMRTTEAKVDVICHSRGGLVTRWWLEGFDRATPDKRRAVFLGAPLNGTGLAAPANLRASLSLLANISRALKAGTGAASALPLMAVVSGLFHIFSSVTSLLAKTPAVDAAVAMVPGLAAMSRASNNFEILSLRRKPDADGRYFVVCGDFESAKVGWKFWKVFSKLPERLKDTGADIVFDGKNDLVVDTPSMANFEDALSLPSAQILDYGTTDKVHHMSYFRQRQTLEFIMEKLREPGG